MEALLGISAFYHDSAAALVIDGKIVAAAQEERFTRIKHDAGFPRNAIKYVLDEGGLTTDDLDAVIFYEKSLLKFERLLETYHAFAPFGMVSFLKAIPVWLKDKLFIKQKIQKELLAFGSKKNPILFTEHHLSHSASAFFPSPFQEAAILTVDGVGEWATATISHGKGNEITLLREQHFPHSLGLLYSAFTYYLGFRVNSGEYKLMGLAPYADPNSKQVEELIDKIKSEIVDIKEDGSILLNMSYFSFATGLKMTNNKKWGKLFGFSKREPESEITSNHIHLAFAAQKVTEEIVVKLAVTAKKITGAENLCMAGGVALNCVANSKILEAGLFKNVWVQPASGDAGGALGAAYAGWYIGKNKTRTAVKDQMEGAFLGPEFSDKEISKAIKSCTDTFTYFDDSQDLVDKVAEEIAAGKIVGWFQGRMEFGPRALGSRSILADPRNVEMQKRLNLMIKFREGFRPFAPCVLEEDASNYFELNGSFPYMLFTFPIKINIRFPEPDDYASQALLQKLYHKRSILPAITHIDYSARVQTVSKETNNKLHLLLESFKRLTGCSVLINTSFNVRGEPIVCSPKDAIECFYKTKMDILILGNFMLDKNRLSNFPAPEPKIHCVLD